MTFAWLLFAAYLGGTAWLGWVGHKRTRGFGSFALGGGHMHPFVVGVTLAAATASAATFIVNPGFVYVDGFSAWFHLVPGLVLGLCGMLFVLSFRFRRIGASAGALTVPHWIGQRYRSRAFALYFSVLTLLSFAFVVLLVGGIAIVMQPLLGVSNVTALTIALVFVTAYVFVGGTHAHVLTNLLQGTLMIAVALIVLASCVSIVAAADGGVVERLRGIDPNLLRAVNPEGRLFSDVFSIYVAGFVIGAVVACQPHILTKALYVDGDRALAGALWIFAGVFVLFALLVTVGFVAHLVVPPEALIDPASGAFRQDLVMTAYLREVFPDWVFTIIAVVLLAAAMSTLDGLLVSLSTITANDLVLNALPHGRRSRMSEAERMRFALSTSHAVLVIVAVAAFVINLEPPRLLGIFGQVGVYGLAVATAPPLVIGVLYERPPLRPVWLASLAALLAHFGLYFAGPALFPQCPLPLVNPGVTAAIATLATLPPLLLYLRFGHRSHTRPA